MLKICYIFLLNVFIISHCVAQKTILQNRESVLDGANLSRDTSLSNRKRFGIAGEVWKSAILSAPGDFNQMGAYVTKDWRKTSAYLGGIALLILADKPVTQWYQDKVEKNINYQFPKLPNGNFNLFFSGNDAYLNYSIIALYGGSFLGKYKTGQRAALNSLKALTYSYLICQVSLKALFARQRPDPKLSDGIEPKPPFTGNPHDFFNFRRVSFTTGPDATSFPSFHATSYYAVAKVLAMEFHNYWIPYSTVTLLFFADVDSHRHWVGDMIAGGLLGTLIGHGIVSSSRLFEKKRTQNKIDEMANKRPNMSYQILPTFSSNMAGLTFHLSL